MRFLRSTLALPIVAMVSSGLAVAACDPMAPPVARPALPLAPTASPSATVASSDPLGERPIPARPDAYTPPVPKLVTTKSGLTVWHVPKHGLPLVSMTLVVPGGSASDPKGKEGLTSFMANMLDEGAGSRGALELSRTFESLGAQVKTGAVSDYAFAQITVLRKNMVAALAPFSDVVAKPTFAQADFSRVKELWLNDLRARRSDPAEVAKVAGLLLHYGPEHPYGHPTEGTPKGAAQVTLADVKESYGRTFRKDSAILVVVGDVSEADLESAVIPAFDALPAGKGEKPKPVVPGDITKKRRIVVVDRPDAPQSVVALLLPSLPGGSDDAPLLSRVNVALGGSFTSRLNQDLREERGITYGASSRLSFSRGAGVFIAQASVESKKTGEAVKALLQDVIAYAKDGPTDDEIEKTRLVARADLVEAYEGVSGSAARLARLAGIGLPPGHEASSAKARDEASAAKLRALAKTWLDPADGIVLVVGPKSQVLPTLTAAGLPTPEPFSIE